MDLPEVQVHPALLRIRRAVSMRIDARNEPHGTAARYNWCKRRPEGSCSECRRAAARRKNERELERARGATFFLSTALVLDHIDALRKAGVGVHAIAKAADMSSSTLSLLMQGKKKRIGRPLHDRILAVEARPYRLPPRASVLRFQALQAAGYSRGMIAAKMSPDLDGRIANLRVDENSVYVTRPLAEALVRVCREVGLTPGSSAITRQRALKRKLRPPADFDEEQFLDVDWDGVEDELVLEERADALLEDVELIEKSLREPSNDKERAWNRALVEERTGVTYAYINTLRQRRASREWKARRDTAA